MRKLMLVIAAFGVALVAGSSLAGIATALPEQPRAVGGIEASGGQLASTRRQCEVEFRCGGNTHGCKRSGAIPTKDDGLRRELGGAGDVLPASRQPGLLLRHLRPSVSERANRDHLLLCNCRRWG